MPFSCWQRIVITALIVTICAIVPLALRRSSNQLPASTIMILQQADRFELLSLDPRLPDLADEYASHGYRVLASVPISDPHRRQMLVSALLKGMRENAGTIAACFNPRHGIHALYKGKQADLVICFQCLQLQLFGDSSGEFLISDSPQGVFQASLKAGALASDLPPKQNERCGDLRPFGRFSGLDKRYRGLSPADTKF